MCAASSGASLYGYGSYRSCVTTIQRTSILWVWFTTLLFCKSCVVVVHGIIMQVHMGVVCDIVMQAECVGVVQVFVCGGGCSVNHVCDESVCVL